MEFWRVEFAVVLFLSSVLVSSAYVHWDVESLFCAKGEDSVKQLQKKDKNRCWAPSSLTDTTALSRIAVEIQRGGDNGSDTVSPDAEGSTEESNNINDEDEDENAKLDAMIEQLVKSVSSSDEMDDESNKTLKRNPLATSNAGQEPVGHDIDEEAEKEDEHTNKKYDSVEGSVSITEFVKVPKQDSMAFDEEAAVDEVSPVKSDHLRSSSLTGDQGEHSSVDVSHGKKKKPSERKSKRKGKSKKQQEKQELGSQTKLVSAAEGASASRTVDTEEDQAVAEGDRGAEAQQNIAPSVQESSPSLPPPPPNALYRFLLRRGHVGHILVIATIVIVDLVEQFLPPVYKGSRMVLLRLHLLPDPKYAQQMRYVTPYYTDGKASAATTATNVEYSGIVSEDRGIGSSKVKKAKRQREDALALQKLIKVGSDISVAKYKHLSVDFMRR